MVWIAFLCAFNIAVASAAESNSNVDPELAKIDAILDRAKNFEEFAKNKPLQDESYRALSRYFGPNRLARSSFDMILQQQAELDKKISGYGNQLWKKRAVGPPIALEYEVIDAYPWVVDQTAWQKYYGILTRGYQKAASPILEAAKQGEEALKAALQERIDKIQKETIEFNKNIYQQLKPDGSKYSKAEVKMAREKFTAELLERPESKELSAYFLYNRLGATEEIRDKLLSGDSQAILTTLAEWSKDVDSSLRAAGFEAVDRIPIAIRENVHGKFQKIAKIADNPKLVTRTKALREKLVYHESHRGIYAAMRGATINECIGGSCLGDYLAKTSPLRHSVAALEDTRFHFGRVYLEDGSNHYTGFTEVVPQTRTVDGKSKVFGSMIPGDSHLNKRVYAVDPKTGVMGEGTLFELYTRASPSYHDGYILSQSRDGDNAQTMKMVRGTASYILGENVGTSQDLKHLAKNQEMVAAIVRATPMDSYSYGKNGQMVFDAQLSSAGELTLLNLDSQGDISAYLMRHPDPELRIRALQRLSSLDEKAQRRILKELKSFASDPSPLVRLKYIEKAIGFGMLGGEALRASTDWVKSLGSLPVKDPIIRALASNLKSQPEGLRVVATNKIVTALNSASNAERLAFFRDFADKMNTREITERMDPLKLKSDVPSRLYLSEGGHIKFAPTAQEIGTEIRNGHITLKEALSLRAVQNGSPLNDVLADIALESLKQDWSLTEHALSDKELVKLIDLKGNTVRSEDGTWVNYIVETLRNQQKLGTPLTESQKDFLFRAADAVMGLSPKGSSPYETTAVSQIGKVLADEPSAWPRMLESNSIPPGNRWLALEQIDKSQVTSQGLKAMEKQLANWSGSGGKIEDALNSWIRAGGDLRQAHANNVYSLIHNRVTMNQPDVRAWLETRLRQYWAATPEAADKMIKDGELRGMAYQLGHYDRSTPDSELKKVLQLAKMILDGHAVEAYEYNGSGSWQATRFRDALKLAAVADRDPTGANFKPLIAKMKQDLRSPNVAVWSKPLHVSSFVPFRDAEFDDLEIKLMNRRDRAIAADQERWRRFESDREFAARSRITKIREKLWLANDPRYRSYSAAQLRALAGENYLYGDSARELKELAEDTIAAIPLKPSITATVNSKCAGFFEKIATAIRGAAGRPAFP